MAEVNRVLGAREPDCGPRLSRCDTAQAGRRLPGPPRRTEGEADGVSSGLALLPTLHLLWLSDLNWNFYFHQIFFFYSAHQCSSSSYQNSALCMWPGSQHGRAGRGLEILRIVLKAHFMGDAGTGASSARDIAAATHPVLGAREQYSEPS